MQHDDVSMFELASGHVLVVPGFPEPRTRAEAFPSLDPDAVHSSRDLIALIDSCPPLEAHLRLLGHEFVTRHAKRPGTGSPGSDGVQVGPGYPIASPQLVMRVLQRDPDEGWRQWIEYSGDVALESFIQAVRDWLAARVNWDECAHFEQPWNGQQAALDHFRVYSASMLKALGIRIVQGDRPGSIYEAAELHKEIEKANEVAELLELECRFRRAAQVDQEAGDV